MNTLKTIALAIALLLFTASIALSITAGLKRITKIGLGVVVLGFSILVSTRYAYLKYLSSSTEFVIQNANRGAVLLNLMAASFWILGLGGLLVFTGSTVRTWERRFELFPFLFKSENKEKG